DAQAARRPLSAPRRPESSADDGLLRTRAGAEIRSPSHMATCYRHPSRETGVSCSNCGRPICPDCMTTTPVGMRCPDCARQRTKVVRMRDMATVPRVTYGLIVLNLLAYLTEQGQFTLFGATIHGKVIEEGVLWRYGVSVEHQYWRLVSSAFLHENILHIGFKMYLVFLLGMMFVPANGRLE